ncbi:MAG TPA: UDP-N-acetylmuramate dehydrogenase [Victivallales bacterium]|nr:UDP-N-acetylmuramate dehydrogenase [Victivallales bacterium]
MLDIREEFKNISIRSTRFDVAWSEITTLGVGGKVSIFTEPEDDIELRKILAFCKDNKLEFLIIGAGSNIVGTDATYDGVVIRLSGRTFKEVSFGRKGHVTAGAGVKLRDLAELAAQKGFGGMEELAGIPATVGGAIKMNAGAEGISIGDFLEEICGVDSDGNIWKASKNEIKFSYRKSSISDDKIIIAAILKLEQKPTTDTETKIKNVISRRTSVRFEGRNAGSAFVNPGDAKAGIILEKSACKKMSFGNAMISEKHANYFINKGSASEADFLNLMIAARKKVFESTGILLYPEVKFVNGESYEKLISSIKPIKVALLKGGSSNERNISLISAKYVAGALRDAGMKVEEIDILKPEMTDSMKKADIVFPVLHGGFGEDGEIQELLEKAKIKFVGSSSASCKLTIDKITSKKLMLEKGIPTADFEVVTKHNRSEVAKFAKRLGLPLVIKAPKEGSTVGISILEDLEKLDETIEKTFSFGDEILLEKFIKGREITIGVLHGKALPVIEIEFPGATYDFDAKYTHAKGETKYHCPPVNVPETIQKKSQKIAELFYEASGARDMLRIDMIFDGKELFVLEANSIPGFTDSSLLPKAAKAAGISFTELCAGLAIKAWQRN